MPPEKMMHGNIPLPAKLQPVTAIPPIAVEMSIRETCDFCESAEHVFEDDEEDEEEGDHEGEEEEGDGFREDQEGFGCGVDVVEAEGSVVEDWHDEFFAGDGKEEDAAEDGKGFPEELEVVDAFGAGVFEFVAESWAEHVVYAVAEGEVLWVGDLAKGGGEFEGEIFAEFGEGFVFVCVLLLLYGVLVFTEVGLGAWVTDGCCSGGAFRLV